MSAAGTVARLRASFEAPQLPGLGEGGAATPGSAPASQQRVKQMRLWSAFPLVSSPNEGAGPAAATAAAAGGGLAARQLWPVEQLADGMACGTDDCSEPLDEAARAARLDKIRAR